MAQDDATRDAIWWQERLGLDVLTDGEIRRESYANRFTTALDGLDLDPPGAAYSRTGRAIPVPRVVGAVKRSEPILVRDAAFLRASTAHPVKTTLPGPFTMSHQTQDEYYHDPRALAMDLAAAVNAEILDLERTGVDVVQIDEPLLQAWPDEARAYGIEAMNRALQGTRVTTALHTCFGYGHIVADRPPGYPFFDELAECHAQQISLEAAQLRLDPSVLARLPDKTFILGVIDIVDQEVESVEQVAERIRAALGFVAPERLVLGTDCGMKYLNRDVAEGKLRSLVEAAGVVRSELGR
jgi:5-methyltetrahydropteroyltriglutamate--homocysteine methyltransferase